MSTIFILFPPFCSSQLLVSPSFPLKFIILMITYKYIYVCMNHMHIHNMQSSLSFAHTHMCLGLIIWGWECFTGFISGPINCCSSSRGEFPCLYMHANCYSLVVVLALFRQPYSDLIHIALLSHTYKDSVLQQVSWASGS